MHEAILNEKRADGRVRCGVCARRCVVAPGACGACGTRELRDGVFYTRIYDRVSAVHLDPIEKKPLFHFHPATRVLSLGSVGCSFRCPGCQNAEISRADTAQTHQLTPAAAVDAALRAGAAGLCWTYNDPAIWVEHTLEGARLAKAHGLYTAYVTNGSATRAHLDLIGPYLDAYRVDIKAFTRDGYRAVAGFADLDAILDGTAYAKTRWGMHVECVTNVTPTINDSDADLTGIAGWIADALGPETPWHVTRFHPCEGFAHLPATPLATLDRAWELGKAAGLRYVYVGNVPGDPRGDTRCPACDAVVLVRRGFQAAVRLRDGACPECGQAIAGRWG
jgi:pyruvate formate lyase activating enzyme